MAQGNWKTSGGGTVSADFASLSGNPSDNANLDAALDLKADLVGGVIPSNQLPVGVGLNRITARVVASSNITIATALNNGDTIDSVVLATNDIVLVAGQTAPAENGIYVVGAVPARHTSYDTYAEHAGLDVSVSEGTAKAGSLWRFTSGATGTIGVDALTVTQTNLVGALLASNNLSDVTTAATARTNLGLGNVDNTSDANKPVSTATQTAIDAGDALRVKFGTTAPTGGDATGFYLRYGKPFNVIPYFDGATIDDTYTYATLPTAGSTYNRCVTHVSDIGGLGGIEVICLEYSTGNYAWIPLHKWAMLVQDHTLGSATAMTGSEVTFGTYNIPGGLVIPGCTIWMRSGYILSGTASLTMTPRVKINGTSINAFGRANTSAIYYHVQAALYVDATNRNQQYHLPLSANTSSGFFNGEALAVVTRSFDFSTGATATWTVQGTAPDTAQVFSRELEIIYP